MSQTQAILAHLKRGNSIDPLVALRLYGSFRLAARILELREYGIKVRKQMVKNRSGAKFARYSLA